MRNHEINSNNIADTIDNICTVPVSVRRGTEYRVLISYTDGQGYESTTTSGSITLTDVDRDNDGLIEVDTAEQLNAIRHQLNGSGYSSSGTATITLGCPVTDCKGYELKAHLDLDGMNWQPLGSYEDPFNAIFKGNNHTISNLTINSTATDYVGLFAATTTSAEIYNVGLLNVNIDAGNGNNVGGLVGHNQGTIENSYAIGNGIAGQNNVGGLVGHNEGTIAYSHVSGKSIAGQNNVGGLVGHNQGTIENSYAIGNGITGQNNVGGLVGHNEGTIKNSYVSSMCIKGASNVGALIGTQFSNTVNTMNKVSNNYATINTLYEGMISVCKLIGNGIMIKGNQLIGGCADNKQCLAR